jgi:acetyl esterase/lipase
MVLTLAISWVFENADLFGGNAQEIIPIGYGAGAFHLATFLSHKEFQDSDDFIAGAALVSGIYEPTKDTDESERRPVSGPISGVAWRSGSRMAVSSYSRWARTTYRTGC